ncbi:flagellin N-terminal helical domain-containing protein [Lutispora thermophila]|uniref:Flagellin n=1 Tax=Lutispora thermophila DSM 19022 TaxID=1122184 RepID=A0A1M6AQC8_9FIRM|nr:flagellin [Lutispora thermophila]SHI38686.1 flagellin [Lutispora thermophila DSM 19022]
MRINNNLMAMNTHRQLSITNTSASKSMEKLSSGYRINRAGDDAAGLSISEKMRSQIRGLNMASKNAQDGISLIQVAEGALTETHEMLQRMRELVVQAANDTNTTEERIRINEELAELEKEITAITEKTEFNKKTLLSGSFATSEINLQVGANCGQFISFTIGNMSASEIGVSGIAAAVSNGDANAITAKIKDIDTAIEKVSVQRSKLGAIQNRLEHTIKNLDNTAENLQAAESRIRDVDMAKEMMEFTRQNILQQAATSILAQANQAPQTVLQLLR